MRFLALEKYGLKFTFEKIGCSDLAENWTRAVFYDYLKMYVGFYKKIENCQNGRHFEKKWRPF